MDRGRLVAALERPEEAHQAAREALVAGDDFEVWDEHVPAEELRNIYKRRERHTVKMAW